MRMVIQTVHHKLSDHYSYSIGSWDPDGSYDEFKAYDDLATAMADFCYLNGGSPVQGANLLPLRSMAHTLDAILIELQHLNSRLEDREKA